MMTVKINKEHKQVTATFQPKRFLHVIFEFNYEQSEALKRQHTMVNIIADIVYVNIQVTTTETLEEVMKKVLHLKDSDEIMEQYAYCMWAK